MPELGDNFIEYAFAGDLAYLRIYKDRLRARALEEISIPFAGMLVDLAISRIERAVEEGDDETMRSVAAALSAEAT